LPLGVVIRLDSSDRFHNLNSFEKGVFERELDAHILGPASLARKDLFFVERWS